MGSRDDASIQPNAAQRRIISPRWTRLEQSGPIPSQVHSRLSQPRPQPPPPPLPSPAPSPASMEFRGCRHRLVLLINRTRYGCGLREVLVWNPVAGERHLQGTWHVSDPEFLGQVPF
ncbi:hypothetical protein PVAP13_8KG016360 [Panicum virgatum]|uniref:Uncharacterized protein n=1 Tax=Panicum virgatum TaxID=38727 RepID=A0A8T0PHZ3_PANVG|nr:hypothetical protein PVAP13_8KG016360 [Panicum virgatum]